MDQELKCKHKILQFIVTTPNAGEYVEKLDHSDNPSSNVKSYSYSRKQLGSVLES